MGFWDSILDLILDMGESGVRDMKSSLDNVEKTRKATKEQKSEINRMRSKANRLDGIIKRKKESKRKRNV